MVKSIALAGIVSQVLITPIDATHYTVEIRAHRAEAKIYDAQPASVGVPLQVLPPNVRVEWPAATPFKESEGDYSAYVGHVQGKMTLPEHFVGDIELRYGVCHKVCVLEKVTFKSP